MGQTEEEGRLAARFLIAPGKHENAVRETLAAIERVHGADWDWARILPCVTVDWSRDTSNWTGQYTPPRRRFRFFGSRQGARIRLWTQGCCPRFVFAHEFGHLLDDAAIAFRNRTTTESAFAEVIRLARQSESYRQRDGVMGTGELLAKQEKNNAHRLLRREVWAEIYSQYIALRADDAELTAEWEAIRSGKPHLIWPDDDFAPLAEALDQILPLGSAALIPNRH